LSCQFLVSRSAKSAWAYRCEPETACAGRFCAGEINNEKSPRADLSSALVPRASQAGRFDSQAVVDRDSELLLAAQVALGRLDRDLAEQELDLIQYPELHGRSDRGPPP